VTIPAFQRLARVLDLEEKQKWRNRGVIGGLQAMAGRWADDAQNEGADPRAVAALTDLMRRYGTADAAARPALAETMRGILTGAPLPEEPEREEVQEVAPLEIPPGEPAPGAVVGDEIGEELAPPPLTEPKPEFGMGFGAVIEAEPDDLAPPEPAAVTQARLRRQQQQSVRRNPRDLQADVTVLSGVGQSAAQQLARLGIEQVVDLLWHLPSRYDDYSQMRTISQLAPGEQVTIIANLWDVRERKISMNRTVVQAILGDSTGTLHATWWNKWVKKQLQPGVTLRFSGKVGLYMGQKTLDNPVFEELEDERVATGRLSPVYPLTEGLTNSRLRNLIHDVLDGYAQFLTDPLPGQVVREAELLDLVTALRQIHFPDSQTSLLAARRRLAFEELFYIQLGVQQRRHALRQAVARALPLAAEQLAQFEASLPFEPTGAQRRVIDEIRLDLARTVPMTRLVQGDVGSGKTAVAAAAMYAAVLNGTQAALLAPTQILAEQHHRGIGALLGQLTRPDGAPIAVALLTGRVTGEARAQALAGLGDGTADVVVGTTALIQEGVEFADLGLVIVDEQHRFGVEQRGALRSKAADAVNDAAPDAAQPHLLVMSATPIPRSLALTVYGDLDVSRIDELPPGRSPIRTKRFLPGERERLYSFIRREVTAGRQAYVIYPLVEESDKLDVGAAVEAQERLQAEIFPELKVGLLHGRMTGTEKDEVMRAFAAGDTQILVSTTVVEVGIDVPNASVMVVEDADRFGLAQLHQLRGRVGRGEHASYCALISRAETPDVAERLRVLEETNDGFVLAEQDLALRGPGEFLGTRQSGLPDLRVAQLSDTETIAAARIAAQRLFEQDPELNQYPNLAGQVERFWRGHGDVS
jgi:ATP-dependent DNA helicase RecG